MMRLFIIIVTIIVLFSAGVFAEDQAPQPKTSITISPFHFLSPSLQVMGEKRLGNKTGAAAIVGAGWLTEEDIRAGSWEVGGQFRYYPIGSFTHGMVLGAELSYLHASGDHEFGGDYCVGTRIGTFLGYKIAMKIGLTFDLQLGPEYIIDNSGNTQGQTLRGFRIGWSF
jgi:hypothetical protein